MPKYVYDFAEGNRSMADLLGSEGADLAEMTAMGLPVPPGFTVTTEACRLTRKAAPAGLFAEVGEHLHTLERAVGRKLGQVDQPLLVAVRSGARFAVPGTAGVVLDVGLTDDSVAGLAAWSGDDRLAWDAYRRLVRTFGTTVLGVDDAHFAAAEAARGATGDRDLDAAGLRALTTTFKEIVREHTGHEFPQEPREQLDLAITSVFQAWHADRARTGGRAEHVAGDLGAAVTVCAVVFGDLGDGSATGVAFTRDPATGAPGVHGHYLPGAAGVTGTRDPLPLRGLAELQPAVYAQLAGAMRTLEEHHRDLCAIDFTIERRRLWLLRTRAGERSAAAAFRIADALRVEGLIDADEALRRVTGAQLAQLMLPRFADTGHTPVATGTGAAPGVAVGAVVFDAATAVRRAEDGVPVILVRRETGTRDLAGLERAEGVLTSGGDETSHAALVARGLGRACVCGAASLTIDPEARRCTTADGTVVVEGDVISLDGTTGAVHLGALDVVPSPVLGYFEGRPAGRDDLLRAVDRIVRHADRRGHLQVRANADTPGDARRARLLGAKGIGLCRTEHLFLGDRRDLVERLVLAPGSAARGAALAALLPLLRADCTDILEEMNGLPVTIRLLDAPLHEFLPDRTELTARVAVAKALGQAGVDEDLLCAVERLHERNPLLGTRGVRLGLVLPELYDLQVRAIAEAAVARVRAGGVPRADIVVPLVGDVRELEVVAGRARRVLAEVAAESGVNVTHEIGAMVELPRAALTAGHLAGSARFFSFGTDDLTQTVWGVSRADAERSLFGVYRSEGVFAASPFETIDRDGVGTLIDIAAQEGRATRPDLRLGVCGGHGGDPASIRFFHDIGLDHVSCAPSRVPVARLEAGRAAVAVDDR